MSKPMTPLIIDAQLLQTSAWDRGMGHYCRSLIKALGEFNAELNVTFILNKHLPLDARREQIQALLPKAELCTLDLPTLSGHLDIAKKRATKEIDRFILSKYGDEKVGFLILQLFTFDYCAAFPTNADKLVVCYDLIPLIYWSEFSGYFAAHMYFPHLITLLEADTIFSISETTKAQLEERLSVEPRKVVNINGACISREMSEAIDYIDENSLFILMPSADLPHKNNEMAVQAFEQFNRELGNIFKLVITSTISESTRELLRCYSDDLVFTGNINDRQLKYLYQKSRAVLFVSLVEGLGLPVLEAVSDDKPVVCSEIPVFKEISNSAFYYCDPLQTDSIARALRRAVAGSNWTAKRAEYKEINKKYTWRNSAITLGSNLRADSRVESSRPRANIAICLPHPSSTSSQLGGFVQSLFPVFKRLAEVSAYLSADDYVNEGLKPLFLPYLVDTMQTSELDKAETKPIYFIDNSSASTELIRAALLKPGVCFVVNNDIGQLMKHLASWGYISTTLALAGERVAKNNLAGLLMEASNEVYMLDAENSGIQRCGQKARTKVVRAKSRWELAHVLLKEAGAL